MEKIVTEISLNTGINTTQFGQPFWVIWIVELWERFGYFGMHSILALYFVHQLGYSQSQSFYVFGSFTALAYGFIWIGGWIGDAYLGAKRTMLLGAIVLMLSYASLTLASQKTIFYSLAGVIVGTSLFKANPSSLISKLYENNGAALDSAMTLYYMAINVGSMLSIALTPIISEYYGWSSAFAICAIGLLVGIINYVIYQRHLLGVNSDADKLTFSLKRILITLVGSVLSLVVFAQLLNAINICNWVIYTVVSLAFIYYFWLAFQLKGGARIKMMVALILILQGVLFYVLYNQMPTSLTFFALNNVNNTLLGWKIPAAEYQVLNPIIIVLTSPILAWVYSRWYATHVTKFCVGMSLCAIAFLVLAVSKYTATANMVSPWWMVLSYLFQSVGELLVSGLGLAMVAKLCPKNMSGYVMGVWWLACMLAGPISAWVGALTAPVSRHYSTQLSLAIYTNVFKEIGIVTVLVAVLMWAVRPYIIKLL